MALSIFLMKKEREKEKIFFARRQKKIDPFESELEQKNEELDYHRSLVTLEKK